MSVPKCRVQKNFLCVVIFCVFGWAVSVLNIVKILFKLN